VCHLLFVYCPGAWAIKQRIRDWREVSVTPLKNKTFNILEVTGGSWKREEGRGICLKSYVQGLKKFSLSAHLIQRTNIQPPPKLTKPIALICFRL